MSTVLQTTVSQLEVARGQRRDHAPNVRAVEPGEAKGNLYLLLELTGPQEGRSRLYRQLLGEVQSAYYNTAGNLADVLHTAVSQGHRLLSQSNSGRSGDQRWRGGMSCLALWQDHIYLAQAGPAMVMVTHPATVEMFPVYAEPPQGALGDEEAPMIDLYHTRVEPGNAVLLLESGWGAQADLEALASAATAPDLVTISDYLAQLAEDAHLTALVVTLQEGLDSAPALQRGDDVAQAPALSPSKPGAAAQPPMIPLVPDDMEEADADWPAEEAWWEDADSTSDARAVSAAAPARPPTTGGPARSAGNIIEAGRTLIKRILPDSPSAPPSSASDAPAPLNAKTPAPRPPRPRPAAQTASRSRWPLILAIAIPVIILAIVAVMYMLRAVIENNVSSHCWIRRSPPSRPWRPWMKHRRAQLTTAQAQISEALALKPGNADAQEVQGHVQAELDRVNHVTPLYLVTPLKEFEGAGRDLARVLVDGADVFVLDRGRDTVERYRLNQLGDGLVPNDGGPLVTKGQPVGSLVVGELIDMVWAPPVGVRTDSTLLVLDSTGMLYEFRAPWELESPAGGHAGDVEGPRLTASYAG